MTQRVAVADHSYYNLLLCDGVENLPCLVPAGSTTDFQNAGALEVVG